MKEKQKTRIITEYLLKEDGAAMIIVLCVMAIVLAVCLSLLLAVYQLFGTVNDDAKDDIYYHQALSGSIAIQDMLEEESKAMPATVSSLEDFIFYFMANTTSYPAPYSVTLEQTSKTETNAESFGDASIDIEKIDNGSGTWGDDYNCYCYITLKVSDESGEKVSTVTSKYLVTCDNADYTYTATVTGDDGSEVENVTYEYRNQKLVTTTTSIPVKLRKIAYSTASAKSGLLEDYMTIDGVTYSIEITRTRNDDSEYIFQFLERL